MREVGVFLRRYAAQQVSLRKQVYSFSHGHLNQNSKLKTLKLCLSVWVSVFEVTEKFLFKKTIQAVLEKKAR